MRKRVLNILLPSLFILLVFGFDCFTGNYNKIVETDLVITESMQKKLDDIKTVETQQYLIELWLWQDEVTEQNRAKSLFSPFIYLIIFMTLLIQVFRAISAKEATVGDVWDKIGALIIASVCLFATAKNTLDWQVNDNSAPTWADWIIFINTIFIILIAQGVYVLFVIRSGRK